MTDIALVTGTTGQEVVDELRGVRLVLDAARIPVRMATIGPDRPTGTFTGSDGSIPW
jgi:hypothetical protein